jgi:hypothetical protein
LSWKSKRNRSFGLPFHPRNTSPRVRQLQGTKGTRSLGSLGPRQAGREFDGRTGGNKERKKKGKKKKERKKNEGINFYFFLFICICSWQRKRQADRQAGRRESRQEGRKAGKREGRKKRREGRENKKV